MGCSFALWSSVLFSVVSRLRGRHALFPPKGEEKEKSEVEAERHVLPQYRVPGPDGETV
jgi:hypothetical protein